MLGKMWVYQQGLSFLLINNLCDSVFVLLEILLVTFVLVCIEVGCIVISGYESVLSDIQKHFVSMLYLKTVGSIQ